ncbi:MAG: glycerol dehydrogenase [Caldibacillus debilis]|uniref:Glycerol dehydrogenase n=1 Tax=Caldibacillus debilis TaxID=301148 RepID=A0A3E0JZN7_9BACI|nr:glycerol dehydrogenase [Caldibacillus debilis]REJ13473.1 MAG: glycerol dehydrogenase [Caldibacillus debilis]REJ25893.1 MAG: glycerol dehydrogenase [Caldibacillus debilis]
MARILISPGKYIQGKGELHHIHEHIGRLGKSFLFIADEFVMGITKNIIEKSFANTDASVLFETFRGECSKQEIERIKKIAVENKVEVVAGVGGGKTLDTIKAVGYYTQLPTVVVPTVASTDAPCSALSVIYTEEGVFEEYLILPKNPDIVLVDTQIVANAPARLLAAGIGDALATYVEARACYEGNGKPMAGGSVTKAAIGLAELCQKILFEDGVKAYKAVQRKTVTQAVENVVEANTYLSGIGFESGGLAAAHAIHNGFTVLGDVHSLLHGEKVAFGTVTQLVLENRGMDEIEKMIRMNISVGLPVTLEQMGITENVEEKIWKVAEAACSEGETIHNMPFKVTPDDVYAAILTADSIGKGYIK